MLVLDGCSGGAEGGVRHEPVVQDDLRLDVQQTASPVLFADQRVCHLHNNVLRKSHDSDNKTLEITNSCLDKVKLR